MSLEYLKNCINDDKTCSNCENIRYFFDVCIYCKNDNFQKHMKNFKFDDTVLMHLAIIKKNINKKIKTLHNYILLHNRLSTNLKPTSQNIIFPEEIEKCISNFTTIYFDETKSNEDKAKYFARQKYYELFENKYDDIEIEYSTTTQDKIKEYITTIIKKEHLIISRLYITHMIEQKNINIAKINGSISIPEITFLYDILKNKDILDKIKWIIREPYVPIIANVSEMKLDFTLVINIDNSNKIIHIEIDDYHDYEKLTGGHADIRRTINDILKDIYCLFTHTSLIRITNKENAIKILNIYATNKTIFTLYRFYPNYFNKMYTGVSFSQTLTTNQNIEEFPEPIQKEPYDEKKAKARLEELLNSRNQ